MADFPQPGQTIGRYTIGERLGQGGTSTVYRATRSLPRREVALKVIPSALADQPGFRDQFLAEADVLAALESPHIVAIHDIGEDDGFLFIATDLIPGGDLGTRLSRGPVPLKPALALSAQVAAALDSAHRSGVIHRDVKPSNVLLGERDGHPHAFLCDFGIAGPVGAGGTRRNSVVGTYAYLAPEVLTGGAATAASDIYALGCLLVAAITGTPPYHGTDEEIAQQHLTSDIPHWEETSPLLGQLNALIKRSMAKNPADRYPSADDFRTAMLSVLGEVPAAPPAPVPGPIPGPIPAPAPASAPEPVPEPTPAPEAPPVPASTPAPAPIWAPEGAAEQTRVGMPAVEEPLATPTFLADPPAPIFQPSFEAAATPASMPVPDEDDGWGKHDEHQRRGGRVLISSIVALVLVGAAVLGFILFQKSDDNNVPAAGATTTPVITTPPSTPTTTPAPSGNKTCQEGRVIPTTDRCGEPYGLPGLRYVFSNMAGTCTGSRLNTDRYWQIVCRLGGANPATVTYSTYKNTSLGIEHNDTEYNTTSPTTLPSGLVRYGPKQLTSGKWVVSLAYPNKHPYAVEVSANTSAAALQIADTIHALAPGDFVVS